MTRPGPKDGTCINCQFFVFQYMHCATLNEALTDIIPPQHCPYVPNSTAPYEQRRVHAEILSQWRREQVGELIGVGA